MRKVIAVVLSAVFIFLPAISGAEMPEVFTNPEMKDKVAIEQFYKKGPDNKIEGLITRISHLKKENNEERFVIRTVESQYNIDKSDFPKPKGEKIVFISYTVGTDSTLSCENINDVTTCNIVKVEKVCTDTQKGTETLTKCQNENSEFKTIHIKKMPLDRVFSFINKTYINPNNKGYSHTACKSVINKKDIQTNEIESFLETKTESPSFLQKFVGVVLGTVSLAAPIAGVVIGPATTGVTTALTNVGIGAATEATATIAGGVGSKIMDNSEPTQGEIKIPECVVQKAENQKKTE